MAAAAKALGLGTDIVEIDRIGALLAAHHQRFLQRCFRSEEISDLADTAHRVADIAGRWAAKEACLKALGARVSHVPYRDIEVRSSRGTWSLHLHGRAAAIMAERGAGRLLLSVGGDGNRAVAMVVICS